MFLLDKFCILFFLISHFHTITIICNFRTKISSDSHFKKNSHPLISYVGIYFDFQYCLCYYLCRTFLAQFLKLLRDLQAGVANCHMHSSTCHFVSVKTRSCFHKIDTICCITYWRANLVKPLIFFLEPKNEPGILK